jgi:hypothetical protein
VLSVHGTRLRLDGQPFRFRGLSFFNALFNPAFNRDDHARRAWLTKFWDNGVTALRVWCQWDFASPHVFADVGAGQSLFRPTGELDRSVADRLCQLATATTDQGMALEVTLFSQERKPNMALASLAKGAGEVGHLLLPYRNVLLQIWNENNEGTRRLHDSVKSADPDRLVTNSPGFSDDLGDQRHNRLMDVLTPHTVRQPPARFWVDAPRQVGDLVETYGKPVIDDEPARRGLVTFGGIAGGTKPFQHVAHLRATEQAGGYYTYHHDMFQGGYGDPATPTHGIPDPDFNAFHREVFDALVAG